MYPTFETAGSVLHPQPISREKKREVLVAGRVECRQRSERRSTLAMMIEREVGDLGPLKQALTRVIFYSSNEKKRKRAEARVGKERDLTPPVLPLPSTTEPEERYNQEPAFTVTADIVRIKGFQNLGSFELGQRIGALRQMEQRDPETAVNGAGLFSFAMASDVNIAIMGARGEKIDLFQEKDTPTAYRLVQRLYQQFGLKSPHIHPDGLIHLECSETTFATELHSGVGGYVTRTHEVCLRPLKMDEIIFMVCGPQDVWISPETKQSMQRFLEKYPTPEERENYLVEISASGESNERIWKQWAKSNGGLRMDSRWFLDNELGFVQSIDGVDRRNVTAFTEKTVDVRRTVLGDPVYLSDIVETLMYALIAPQEYEHLYPDKAKHADREKAEVFARIMGSSLEGPDNPFAFPALNLTGEVVKIKDLAMLLQFARYNLFVQ